MTDPVRVIMWSVPRSCSSIVAKCMDRVPDSKILFQLYTGAYWDGLGQFNPPKVSSPVEELHNAVVGTDSSHHPDEKSTYPWVKRQLEAHYPGKRFVFAKEMAYCIDGKFEYLPEGYRHIFLIRNPVKVFQSFKRILPEIMAVEGQQMLGMGGGEFEVDKLPPHLVPPGFSFKEAVNLYEYLREKTIEAEPIILDSDDLMNNPATLLSEALKRLGVQYQDAMLTWEKGMGVTDNWVIGQGVKKRIGHVSSFKNFRDSTGFFKSKAVAGALQPIDSLAADVKRCVEFSMPYYTRLYERRLKI
ncbi:uncharacterized protein LOC110989035 [Acanthaster planci]|uniref:Uncharacterized protein LOC110989035 n=1 Tax=Acanthaster planci TaxID=133434 RepID=A0A8B7ZTQ4_ACAPL|nr:uncharacterized protein LOC110989035 [Acanthaster planci]XP_022108806.1 uncharacterized protein LOC110989035 [Acanthaster planci]